MAVTAPEAAIDPGDPGSASVTEARFTGTVDANGKPTEYHFEYSRDEGTHWTATPSEAAGEGQTPGPVEAEVEGPGAGHRL